MRTHLGLGAGAASGLFLIVALSANPARAQGYPTPQASPQARAPMSCYCPFPQGYCPFPSGYCALPCGIPTASPQMASPQGGLASMGYSPRGYAPIPYGTPTPYAIKPLGAPIGSMPSPQSGGQTSPQSAYSMIGD